MTKRLSKVFTKKVAQMFETKEMSNRKQSKSGSTKSSEENHDLWTPKLSLYTVR